MAELKRVSDTPTRLAEAMSVANKKQIDLARETGLSHSTISRYISGTVEPRQIATHKLATALNVSEMWLWGYDVPRERTKTQKKTDQFSQLVDQLRNNTELFEVVLSLSELSKEDFASIKHLILSLDNK